MASTRQRHASKCVRLWAEGIHSNGRLEAKCFDGPIRLAHIRGKLRKKVWINQGDIILLSLREYQDEKSDVYVMHRTKTQARNKGN